MKVARKLWFHAVLAYTLAGLLSATAVGAMLGWVGRWLGGGSEATPMFLTLTLLSLMLAAREMGWISFRLPEQRLQTEKVWAHEFGFVGAAVMWGLHIGLGFATRITYGGFWVLVAAILALGDAAYGAMLMGTYWLGRVLSVWVAPTMLCVACGEPTQMFQELLANRSLYHRIQAVGLVWSAGLGLLMALGLV